MPQLQYRIQQESIRKMDEKEAKLYAILEELNIKDYKVHEHEAIFTSQEAEDAGLTMPGLNLKNLLVKDRKNEEFYLIILSDQRHMEEKHFRKLTGWGKIRFARAEELMELLNLTPGSVTPFGLIFDTEKRVSVVLGKEITDAPDEEMVNFHPNRNTATMTLAKKDFVKFLDYIGCRVIWEQ